ncbi:zinc-ribbon domain-containing protein [Butyrivibrio sp. ob235]|uniref:DUF4234 domain-containing protein n=1 Tax=unclassified Butyrivibrio TaxID=2639466 RepID=UPI0003B2E984|nr:MULTISPECIES: DUF4234 domain-containing protein [unclassified Butyrivibrio]SEL51275.1 zinc-ribbon domain-containing protein [Butyrivibrio sp. ob235]
MFCTNCGAENPDSSKFCTNCGAPLGVPNPGQGAGPEVNQNAGMGSMNDQNSGFIPQNDQPVGFDPQNSGGYNSFQPNQPAPYYGGGISGRSIALAIVLSIVTCGIYSIYWFIVLTDESNQLSGRSHETSGVIAFLLTFVTCGIYGWYWAYKMGEKTDQIKNTPNGSSAVLFIILQIVGLGIVNYALAQDAINKAVGFQG